MKLLIIRHGDPDYSVDSLTEKGWKEAELLSRRLSAMNISAVYMSPLGRARDTASLTRKALRREAEVLPWLQEFPARAVDPETGEKRLPWDWLPSVWTRTDAFYDKDGWADVPAMRAGDVGGEARRVWNGLDALLSSHGYERDGRLYRAVRPNRDTVALFCHFGVECVMLAHLLGISPVVLWHGACALPSSVTTLVTEERRPGIAYFRMLSFGDTCHLAMAGEKPSFSARFSETRDDDRRRD